MSSRVDLKTGFGCNNRCRFCVQGDKRARYAGKSTEELLALLEEARADADEIVFTGGEVTVRPDLAQLVAAAKRLGFRTIQIQTNGRMLSYMKFAKKLVAAGATEFAPALHGPDAALHDFLTTAPGSFQQTVRGIHNVKKLGRPVITNTVITRANAHRLPEVATMLVGLGVDQFQLAFVHPLGTASERFDEIVPRLSEVQPFVLEALAIGQAAGVRCMTEAIPLCFLPGYVPFAAEWVIPRTRIFDATWTIEDYTEYRVREGKAKGPPCASCALNAPCEGPWREYPARFGWAEFVPIPIVEGAPAP